MMELQPCPACRRHVREQSCVFCGCTRETTPSRPGAIGQVSRALVFAGAALATACGGKGKSSEAPEHETHHGGGGCVEPDPDRIADLERRKEQAASEEEKRAIENELERARMPMCMPYGAPPARSRRV